MEEPRRPRFSGGRNIAMKIPPRHYAQTLRFYRDVLALPALAEETHEAVFRFGSHTLWLDRNEQVTHTEVWLELETDDLEAAAAYLEAESIERCDEVEALPEGMRGLWIRNPAGVVHLLDETGPVA